MGAWRGLTRVGERDPAAARRERLSLCERSSVKKHISWYYVCAWVCRNLTPSYRLAQHGISADDYGSLYGLSLGSAAAAACKPCPRLAGIVQSSAPAANSKAAGFSGPVVLAGGGVSLAWRMHDGGATFAVGS